ncbi:hypothetical protein NQZ68_025968, partial [Dissostichus eleginoides]
NGTSRPGSMVSTELSNRVKQSVRVTAQLYKDVGIICPIGFIYQCSNRGSSCAAEPAAGSTHTPWISVQPPDQPPDWIIFTGREVWLDSSSGRCSGESVSSRGLLCEGVIRASVLSAGKGSRGKALHVPGEEGNRARSWKADC